MLLLVQGWHKTMFQYLACPVTRQSIDKHDTTWNFINRNAIFHGQSQGAFINGLTRGVRCIVGFDKGQCSCMDPYGRKDSNLLLSAASMSKPGLGVNVQTIIKHTFGDFGDNGWLILVPGHQKIEEKKHFPPFNQTISSLKSPWT
jgi:hypothetical protein